MQECFRLFVTLAVACTMASCGGASRTPATPTPEAEQAIGEALKELYMAASAAVPQSQHQQKIILQMANKAANGKELLLVMRAADGVFPPALDFAGGRIQDQVRSTVTTKMMQLATLDQLIEYATRYSIDEGRARAYVERMFELGDRNPDPRVWYRIRVAAVHWKVGDLGQKAQARGDELARR